MISTLPPGVSPDLVTLVEHAHAQGIRVWWRDLEHRDAAWSLAHRSIWLRPDLTVREWRSLLAHELGHAYYGDDGPQRDATERRAWRYAAHLLINGAEYAEAERVHGPHLGALADALDVTREVVQAFQAVIERAA